MNKIKLSDIRVVIGVVLGIIGLFLLVCAFFTTNDAQLAKSDGIHANLITGVSMVVCALVFLVWAFFAPEGGRSPEQVERVKVAEAFGSDEDHVEG